MTEKNDTQTLIDEVKQLHTPESIVLFDPRAGDDDPGFRVLAIPSGMKLQSIKPFLDEYRTAPERRAGTATLGDLASFIAHTLRFRDGDSVVYATRDEKAPSVTSVLDYHHAGDDGARARFGKHRGVYTFPLSEPWRAWAAIEGKTLTQADFAAFLEERIMDIQPVPTDGRSEAGALTLDLIGRLGGEVAGPDRMLETARGLRMQEQSVVHNVQNLASGEVDLVFRTTHTDSQGQPLKVPTLFVVGLPVFDGDSAYRMPVRLSYRRKENMLLWTVRRYRPDIVFFDAFDRALDRVRTETGLPVMIGTPEA